MNSVRRSGDETQVKVAGGFIIAEARSKAAQGALRRRLSSPSLRPLAKLLRGSSGPNYFQQKLVFYRRRSAPEFLDSIISCPYNCAATLKRTPFARCDGRDNFVKQTPLGGSAEGSMIEGESTNEYQGRSTSNRLQEMTTLERRLYSYALSFQAHALAPIVRYFLLGLD